MPWGWIWPVLETWPSDGHCSKASRPRQETKLVACPLMDWKKQSHKVLPMPSAFSERTLLFLAFLELWDSCEEDCIMAKTTQLPCFNVTSSHLGDKASCAHFWCQPSQSSLIDRCPAGLLDNAQDKHSCHSGPTVWPIPRAETQTNDTEPFGNKLQCIFLWNV